MATSIWDGLFPEEDEEQEDILVPEYTEGVGDIFDGLASSAPVEEEAAPEPEPAPVEELDPYTEYGMGDFIRAREENAAVHEEQKAAYRAKVDEEATSEDDTTGWFGGRVEAGYGGLRGAAGGVFELLAKPQDIVAPGLAEALFPGEDVKVKTFAEIADVFRAQAEENKEKAHEAMPDGDVARFMTELVDSTLFMAPSVATTRMTGKGDVGLAVMGGMVFGNTFSEQLSEGKGRDEAMKEALIQTAFEIGPEKAFGWFDNLPFTKGVTQWLKQNLVEAASEMTTEELNILYENANGDSEGMTDWTRRFKAAAAGFVMSGTLTAKQTLETPDTPEQELIQQSEDALADLLGNVRDARFKPKQEIEGVSTRNTEPVELRPAEEVSQQTADPLPEATEELEAEADEVVLMDEPSSNTVVSELKEEALATAEEAQDELVNLFRGLKEGGTPRGYAGEHWTEIEELGAEYAKTSESDGTVLTREGFDPSKTFDIDAVANMTAEERQALSDEAQALSEERGIPYEDSYLHDVLIGNEKGELETDFAYPTQEDTDFLRSKGYDNVRYENEGGQTVKSRFILGEPTQQETAQQEQAAEDGSIEQRMQELDKEYPDLTEDERMAAAENASKSTELEEGFDGFPSPGSPAYTEKDNQRFLDFYSASMEGIQNEKEPVAEEPVAPEVPPITRETTSIKHAVIEQERLDRGEAPLLTDEVIGNDETFELAEKIMDANPERAGELLHGVRNGELIGTNRTDQAILLLEKVRISNARSKAADRASDETLTEQQRAAAQEEWAEHEVSVTAIEEAARISGSEIGRALQIRQAMMKKDFSLASMESQARATLGRGLNEAEVELITELSERIKKLEEDAAVTQQELDDVKSKALADTTLRQMNARLKRGERKERDWLKTINARADVSRAWLRENLHNKNAGVNPAAYAHLVTIGASHIANGVVDFVDWVAAMKKDIGSKLFTDIEDQAEAMFGEAQIAAEDKAATESKDGRTRSLAQAVADREAGLELSQRVVYNLAKWQLSRGVHGEADVMEAVTADLQEVLPGIEEREVRQAFVAYGRKKEPSKPSDRKELAELKQLVNLQEEIDRLKEGTALAKNDKVKEAKSVLLANKQRQFNALLRIREAVDPEMQAERYASVNSARLERLKQQVAELTVQLETGEVPVERAKVDETKEVKDTRALRDALQAAVIKIEQAKNPPPTPEEQWNAARTKQLHRQLAEVKERLANNDYVKTPKPAKFPLTKANQKLQLDLHEAKSEFVSKQYDWLQAQEPIGSRVARGAVRSVAIMRSLQTSMDLSGLGRQGFPSITAFPRKVGIPTVKAALESAFSKAKAHAINTAILSDPVIAEARKAGLHIADISSPDMSKREEEFMDKLVQDNIVFRGLGVAATARSYMTSLNVARAQHYKALANSMFEGVPTEAEARQLASLINNATGRGMQTKRAPGGAGGQGQMEQLLNGASTLLYAPRFLLSRFIFPFKMMRGWVPGSKENKQVRKVQRQTSMKLLAAVGALKSLMTLAAIGLTDDDDEVTWNFNPTSSDFMRVKITSDGGKSVHRIDPTLGMGAGIVLMSRIMTGVITQNDGKMVPVREKYTLYEELTGRKVKTPSSRGLVSDFFSYKLSPAFGLAHALAYGENVVGEPVNPLEAVASTGVPLILKDIADAVKTQDNMPMIGALGLAAFLGVPSSGFVEEPDDGLNNFIRRPVPIMQRANSRQERDDEKTVFRFK